MNGDLGLGGFALAAWKLRVTGLSAGDGTAELALDDIQALPRV